MAGTLSAVVTTAQGMTAPLSGDGALAAQLLQSYAVAAGLNGLGAFNAASIKQQFGAVASLSGSGQVGFGTSQIYAGMMPWAGAGSFAASGFARYLMSLNAAGSGQLSTVITAVSLLDFTDLFNRADTATVGIAPWHTLTNGSTDGSISGNKWVNESDADAIGYLVSKDHVRVSVTLGFSSTSVSDGAGIIVGVRGNSDGSGDSFSAAMFLVDMPEGGWAYYLVLYGSDGGYLHLEGPLYDSFNSGDTYSVSALGDNYTVEKNGSLLIGYEDTGHLSSWAIRAANRDVTLSLSGALTVGELKIDAVRIEELSPGSRPARFAGSGGLAATVTGWLPSVIHDSNINRVGVAVPAGATEWRFAAIGRGGNGGLGYISGATARGGGGGGGGAAYVDSGWQPVSLLGSTYSVTRGVNAGAASTFSSGSVSLSAGAGGTGGNGSSTVVGSAGTAGVASQSGLSSGYDLQNGGAGTAGGATGGGSSSAAANVTTGAAPGGSGGAGLSAIGSAGQTGKGGNSQYASGGAARTSAGVGNNGSTVGAEYAGGGGSGGVSSAAATRAGGNGGVAGAGGGGSSAGNSGTPAGGTGAAGMTVMEFRPGPYEMIPPSVVLLTATYSQSNVYGGTTAANMAGMTNDSASGTPANQAATSAGTGNYIRADLGSVKYIDGVNVGYDYLTNLPGGFGVSYTEGCQVQVSNDASAWSTVYTMPSFASSGATAGIVYVPVGFSRRYVRIFQPANNYMCATELAIYGY